MPLITVASPKGGVGKTTLTASLAYALQRMGHPVILIDFDVQNALRLHFASPLGYSQGFVERALTSTNWQQLLVAAPDGVQLLPYGRVDSATRLAFESRVLMDPNFLSDGLSDLLSLPNVIVLADTPPGPSSVLTALVRQADLCLTVLLADAASMVLLPEVESKAFFNVTSGTMCPVRLVLNQVDRRKRLNRDVTAFLQTRCGETLLGMIHRDESLPEALASQQSIFSFDAASAAAHDLDALAHRLLAELEADVRINSRQRQYS
ncbi:cellulose synthase operon protein YhjQ [Pseudomonas duriflava]|uniref:Cellulose synthase operon protein YhjQ n=1 Tax=Pseudomonas duriflava TaxID=459528 RepID=A0A562QI27_9PSED|nr:cellulose biosynthesis protein BcsQ [Pseudomonas duriflava]TWI55706.1 cellulose synthase operon protein YhjQ [Pseudomonas duriflava]